MRHSALILLLALTLLAANSGVQARDSSGVVTIEGTRIRGDQEVPTVMYLVPWQSPEVEELRAPDERLMVGQGLSPLERYEFQRFIQYHQAFIKQAPPATGE
ncbi:hypothetical protein [uncultured Marinobacter sp.]|uniref:hypothetical protein n=1 Tax=uncultured Marinobacter sp. TaxID=187379 RepID=UPI0030D97C22|tara:strand:+ start:195 stop:500 length:306 start_codon:yes stop_codon:yes gene_type:complete